MLLMLMMINVYDDDKFEDAADDNPDVVDNDDDDEDDGGSVKVPFELLVVVRVHVVLLRFHLPIHLFCTGRYTHRIQIF